MVCAFTIVIINNKNEQFENWLQHQQLVELEQ